MISARQLRVKIAQGKVLLHETTFEIQKFKVIALYGPNGSGKTSLLRALVGESNCHDTTGAVTIDQVDINNNISALEKAQKIIYLGSDFQTPFQISVRELLDMAKGVNPLSKENVSEVAERFGISALLNRTFDEMSDGEKQRVMLARGVVQSPRWLILDETFSKVDLDHSFHLAEELRSVIQKNRGVILASHDLNLLSEIADELWLMKDGKLIATGTVEEVLTTENIQLLYPNRKIHVVRSPYDNKKKVIY